MSDKLCRCNDNFNFFLIYTRNGQTNLYGCLYFLDRDSKDRKRNRGKIREKIQREGGEGEIDNRWRQKEKSRERDREKRSIVEEIKRNREKERETKRDIYLN